MSNLLIKKERLPERCEVCHQSDAFDPASGKCKRCEGLFAEKEETKKVKPEFEFIKPTAISGIKEVIDKHLAGEKVLKSTFGLNKFLTKIKEFFQLEAIDTREENLIPLIKADYTYNLKHYLAKNLIGLTLLSLVSIYDYDAIFWVLLIIVTCIIGVIFNFIKYKQISNKVIGAEGVEAIVKLKKGDGTKKDVTTFYAEIYPTNNTSKNYSKKYLGKIKVNKPTWYQENKLNIKMEAKVFKISRKRLLIYTEEGVLISI